MRLIGLTGGIATGKSTVARLLRAHGAVTIDADQVARLVVEPGKPALDAVVSAFGQDVLLPDGTLDRASMRQRIATDPAAKTTLERITHPAILHEITRQVTALGDSGARVIVVEAALMVESGSYRNYPDLLVVTTQPEVQRRRLVARDGPALADALIAAQAPLAEKEAKATWIVHNDGDLQALETELDRIWPALSREP